MSECNYVRSNLNSPSEDIWRDQPYGTVLSDIVDAVPSISGDRDFWVAPAGRPRVRIAGHKVAAVEGLTFSEAARRLGVAHLWSSEARVMQLPPCLSGFLG